MSEQQSNTNLLPAESWNYYPLRERFKENAVSMGVAVGYGLALSQIFNPIALGVVTTGVVLMGVGAASSLLLERKSQEEKPLDRLVEVPDEKDAVYSYYSKVVNAYSRFLKIPAQHFRLAKEEMLFSIIPEKAREKLGDDPIALKKAMEKLAASISFLKVIVVSREFIKKHEHTSVNVALAHEISHIKTRDSENLYTVLKGIPGMMGKLLWPLCLLSIGTAVGGALFGISLPSVFAAGVGAITGTVGFIATSIGAVLGFNYVSRIREYRADRNAMFLTRDLQSATNLLQSMDERGSFAAPQKFEMQTHPSFHNRVKSLQDAFNQVSRYEPLKLDLPVPSQEIVDAHKEEDKNTIEVFGFVFKRMTLK